MSPPYSQKTADLIERMCRNAERKDFVLDKKKAEECLLKTYDLFGLKRPKKIAWYTDIFEKEFDDAARSAGAAWAAPDYDFDWFVIENEYCENPEGEKPNRHDKIYLQYSELLMEAKEAGLGYRVEWEDTLYLVPTPLVLLNQQNQFHSPHAPAIRWKDGSKFYYLNGVNFPFNLWQKVVSREMSMKEVLAIEDIDQRTQAMRFAKDGLREFYKAQKGEIIDTYVKMDSDGNPIKYELWELPAGDVFSKTVHFMIYNCPSRKKNGIEDEYSKGVPAFKTVAEAMAWGCSDEQSVLTPEQWRDLIPLLHES